MYIYEVAGRAKFIILDEIGEVGDGASEGQGDASYTLLGFFIIKLTITSICVQ